MRIELNSGGLQGNAIIEEMKADVNRILSDSLRLDSAFSRIKAYAAYTNGTAQNVSEAIGLIEQREREEQKRAENIRDASRQVETFIGNTRAADRAVAQMIGQTQRSQGSRGTVSQSTVASADWSEMANSWAEETAKEVRSTAAKAPKAALGSKIVSDNTEEDQESKELAKKRREARDHVKRLREIMDRAQTDINKQYNDIIRKLQNNARNQKKAIKDKVEEYNKSSFLKFDSGYNLTTMNDYAVLAEANRIIYEKYVKDAGSWAFSADNARSFIKQFTDNLDMATIEEDFWVNGKKYHLKVDMTNTYGSTLGTGSITSDGKDYPLMISNFSPEKYKKSMQDATKWALSYGAKAYQDMLTELIGWDGKLSSMASSMGADKWKQDMFEKIETLLGDEMLGLATDPNYSPGRTFVDNIESLKEQLQTCKGRVEVFGNAYNYLSSMLSDDLNDMGLSDKIWGSHKEGWWFWEHDVVDYGSDWVSNINSIINNSDMETCSKIAQALDKVSDKIYNAPSFTAIGEAATRVGNGDLTALADLADLISK